MRAAGAARRIQKMVAIADQSPKCRHCCSKMTSWGVKVEGHASSRPRKLAVHCLLPDVRIDIRSDELLFFRRKRWRRQVGEYLIEDEDLDIGLRLLLFPEAIKLRQSGLDRGQQLTAGLLHPFAGCLV